MMARLKMIHMFAESYETTTQSSDEIFHNGYRQILELQLQLCNQSIHKTTSGRVTGDYKHKMLADLLHHASTVSGMLEKGGRERLKV